MTLLEQLKNLRDSKSYPFHMPGHKRNMEEELLSDICSLDITEIDGFDNLHDPQGILLEAQIRAARLFHAEKSYFLINGSTAGILSAISAAVKENGKLLIARNSHKSVYHAIILRNLQVSYLYPEVDSDFGICKGITPLQVEEAIQKEKPDAVLITSPTYEGVISLIEEIAKVVHKYEIPLIIDEAHGAHLGLAEGLCPNSCQAGADLVIQSLHKTLPSMTQTAILHVNGNRINREHLERYLSIYQSSSPSYILMASIDAAVYQMSERGEELFSAFLNRREQFMEQVKEVKSLRILKKMEGFSLDSCKCVISVKDCFRDGKAFTGNQLYDILRKDYQLQMEMAASDYVVAILTIQDKEEGWRRFAEALLEIDAKLQRILSQEIISQEIISQKTISQQTEFQEHPAAETHKEMNQPEALQKKNPGAVYFSEAEWVLPERSIGGVAAEFIYLYPPGIPILVPGEIITDKVISQIRAIEGTGLVLKGMNGETVKVERSM